MRTEKLRQPGREAARGSVTASEGTPMPRPDTLVRSSGASRLLPLSFLERHSCALDRSLDRLSPLRPRKKALGLAPRDALWILSDSRSRRVRRLGTPPAGSPLASHALCRGVQGCSMERRMGHSPRGVTARVLQLKAVASGFFPCWEVAAQVYVFALGRERCTASRGNKSSGSLARTLVASAAKTGAPSTLGRGQDVIETQLGRHMLDLP